MLDVKHTQRTLSIERVLVLVCAMQLGDSFFEIHRHNQFRYKCAMRWHFEKRGKLRLFFFFFFQAEDGIRDYKVTGVQTCALPISCKPEYDTNLCASWETEREKAYGADKFSMSKLYKNHYRFARPPKALLKARLDNIEIGRASCRERV